MSDPYENLANAIILQAVKDYRAAGKKLKRNPKNKDAKLMVEDCESKRGQNRSPLRRSRDMSEVPDEIHP